MSALLTTQLPSTASLPLHDHGALHADASPIAAGAALPGGITVDDPRLAHLFRGSLKMGRIHPLYLPVLRYRLARSDRG